ncbi:MAG: hypothetical protein ABSE67_21895, partial [Xanthobacteraceae bacterium]
CKDFAVFFEAYALQPELKIGHRQLLTRTATSISRIGGTMAAQAFPASRRASALRLRVFY